MHYGVVLIEPRVLYEKGFSRSIEMRVGVKVTTAGLTEGVGVVSMFLCVKTLFKNKIYPVI